MHEFLATRREAILWAEPGLGKTGATLAAADDLFLTGECKGILVVAPLRVSLCTWPDEIENWDFSRWMKVVHLRTPEGQQAWRKGEANIYLCNYDNISLERKSRQPKLVDLLAQNCPVNAIVWDELSKMKSWKSKHAKAFWPYRKFFKYNWGLTGTPAPEGYLDLFAQYRLIDAGKSLGLGITKFKETYFMPDYKKGRNASGEYNKLILQPGAKERIEERIMPITLSLSREEYLHIPPTRTVDIECRMPAEAQRVYDKMEKECLVKLKDGQLVALNAAVMLNKLLQITSGVAYETVEGGKRVSHFLHSAKLDALRKLLDQGENLLVSTSLISERELIHKAFPGIAQEFDEKKWNAGKIKLCPVDPRSVGHGLNLQNGGRIAVWYSMCWSYDSYFQFNCRLARTGQQFETLVYRLLCPDTVDDAVVEALRSKNDEQSGLMRAVRNLKRLAK